MIDTERTKLSTVSEKDRGDLWLLYKNKDVRQFLGGTVTQAKFNEVYFSDFLKPKKLELYWTVRRKTDQAFIGFVCLGKHHESKSLEISYQFIPSLWGQGYAEEVLTEVIVHCFESLNLNQLLAETQTKNLRSVSLLEKLGFKKIKELQRFGADQSLYSKSK